MKTDLLGNSDLEAAAKRAGKLPWLVDADGNWTVRHDVYFKGQDLPRMAKARRSTRQR